jgi:hypothetical protein
LPVTRLWTSTDGAPAAAAYGHLHDQAFDETDVGCIGIVAFVIVAAVAGARPGYVLFALPCMLMMGAMMWMMMGGSGRDSGSGEPKQ